jgi:antirestriction protein ArdC
MIGYFEKIKEEKRTVKTRVNKVKKTVKATVKKAKLKVSEILKGLFDSSLDGWKDDKEKFRLELINDIKTFLFTKWEKPWIAGLIFDEAGKVLSGYRNISGRLYKNSINLLSMERNAGKSPFFITISALLKQGGKLIDKTRVISVLSYIPMFKDKESKTPRKPDWMLPKLHKAVNLDFCEGIKKPIIKEIEFKSHELNQYVESFLKELVKKKRVPKIYNDQADRCFYRHGKFDFSIEDIHMVDFKQFHQIEEYYSTLFHEITHSTQNPARLGRGKLGVTASLDYANEELVAEMGAMILCTELGLKYNRQNGITYLKSWLSGAKGDVDKNLLEAYGYACDSAEYLLEGIDLSKLVPQTMSTRAEQSTPEKQVISQETKSQKKNIERGSKAPEKQEVKSKTQSKPKEQLSLFGHDRKVIQLDKWKPNTHITKLKTDLGLFLGGYERNQYALVLRGEKGAGKTRFLCQAINLFANQNLNCLFLSLEVSPQSELFGTYSSYIDESNKKKVAISSQNTLEELEVYAKKYDVIAIDSWGKLQGIDQSTFGKLLVKYPNVVWLTIFQSTTAGTARGGLMSEYDGSVVVQIEKGGFAVCEKNRYNSCDLVYNVFDKKLVKNEN